MDGDDPDSFVLRLSLPTFTSPFGENLPHTVCVGEYHSELAAAKQRGGVFNLDEQYDKYNECVVSRNSFFNDMAERISCVMKQRSP